MSTFLTMQQVSVRSGCLCVTYTTVNCIRGLNSVEIVVVRVQGSPLVPLQKHYRY